MNRNDAKKHRSQKGLIDPNKVRTFLVKEETTLLPFLMEKASLSNTIARHVISSQQVSVGGVPITLFNFKLYPEDEVLLSRNRIKKHASHQLDIIYEDEDIIAINKPSGLLSIASDREKGHTAYRFVSDYLASKDKNARIFVVHRLDEDTSGVLIFAKNFKVREALQSNWNDIVTKRGYYAIVEGEGLPESGRYEDYLAENSLHLVYVTKNKKEGKLCITNFKKMEEKNGLTLLDVDIETGRKNQIRVQFGYRGHYVIGDDKYGEPSNPIKRLGLHAYQLTFTNPLNGKIYDFKTEMPNSMKSLFWKVRNPKPEYIAKPKVSERKTYDKKRKSKAKKRMVGRH